MAASYTMLGSPHPPSFTSSFFHFTPSTSPSPSPAPTQPSHKPQGLKRAKAKRKTRHKLISAQAVGRSHLCRSFAPRVLVGDTQQAKQEAGENWIPTAYYVRSSIQGQQRLQAPSFTPEISSHLPIVVPLPYFRYSPNRTRTFTTAGEPRDTEATDPLFPRQFAITATRFFR